MMEVWHVGMMKQTWHTLSWISHNFLYSDFPNLSYFPLFLPYSLHFPPKNSWWEAFGFDRFFNFCQFLGELDGSGSCPLWFLLSAGHLQYPLNNFLKNGVGNATSQTFKGHMRAQLPQLAEGIPVAVVTGTNGLDLTWWKCDMLEWWSKLDIPLAGFLTISSIVIFLTFHIFPYFSHIPFISLQRTLDGKRSVLIGFSIFASFWASWMVLAAAHFDFCWVQGISNILWIIS